MQIKRTAKKLIHFLKAHFPLASSYHFLYGVLAAFLIEDGFSLEPVLKAHREAEILGMLISLLPLILIPWIGGKKYLVGSGNWYASGMAAALLVAACLGWVEMSLVLFGLALVVGIIFIQKVKR